MTTQVTSSSFDGKEAVLQAGWVKRSILFIVFLVCEFVIIVLGSNYYDVFPTHKNLTYNLVISLIFLAVSLWFKRTERWNPFWRVAFAFFVASVANPSTWLLDERIHRFLIGSLTLVDKTSQYLGVEKVFEMIVVVVPIIVLTKLSGADLGSIYLKRGNLKLGLGIGALVFIFLGTATFMFAAQRFTSLETLGAAVAWGLVFSFANGFMEELWLRGIFLKRFEPFLKVGGSVLVTSIVFAMLHSFAFYFTPAVIPFFFLNTLSLGLACGYLMMKSDSIWGPVLIHAASDFFLFIALLANA
jgi:membrane protease YdiL (CAAX protease family)